MMRNARQDFFDWTDLCRAVAATLVAASHARDVLMIDYPGRKPWLPFYAVTGLGHSGVIAFFVLSGFWISRSVLRRIDDRSFWPSYLIDRLSRLEIVLVPALVLGGLLDGAGASVLHLPIYQGLTGAHSVTPHIAAALALPVLLGNLAFLQTIVVTPFGSNGPLWSLAFEFWYYIWFPALVVLVRHRRLSPALSALLIGVANPQLYWGFISWLVGWALLMSTRSAPAQSAPAQSALAQSALAKPIGRYWALLAAGLFAAVLLTTGMVRHTRVDGWSDVPLAIGFGLLLLALARSALPFPRLLAPIANYGRKASFSLYAIHFPIVALAGGWVIERARLMPSGRAVLLVVALTTFCLLAGWLFASGSEAFTPHLRDWLRRRLLAPAQPSRDS